MVESKHGRFASGVFADLGVVGDYHNTVKRLLKNAGKEFMGRVVLGIGKRGIGA